MLTGLFFAAVLGGLALPDLMRGSGPMDEGEAGDESDGSDGREPGEDILGQAGAPLTGAESPRTGAQGVRDDSGAAERVSEPDPRGGPVGDADGKNIASGPDPARAAPDAGESGPECAPDPDAAAPRSPGPTVVGGEGDAAPAPAGLSGPPVEPDAAAAASAASSAAPGQPERGMVARAPVAPDAPADPPAGEPADTGDERAALLPGDVAARPCGATTAAGDLLRPLTDPSGAEPAGTIDGLAIQHHIAASDVFEEGDAPLRIDGFARGADLLRIATDLPGEMRVVPSADGADGEVRIGGVLVARVAGAPDLARSDILLPREHGV